MAKQGFFSVFEQMEKASQVHGYECSVKTFCDSLSPEEKNKFQEILHNKLIPTVAISKILQENNVTIGTSQLYKHRQKVCRCFRVPIR